MDTFSAGEEPAVTGGIVTLKIQVSLPQVFILNILNENVFEGELFAGGRIDMRPVGAA